MVAVVSQMVPTTTETMKIANLAPGTPVDATNRLAGDDVDRALAQR